MGCAICGGDCEFMGGLGNLKWFRCIDCGLQFSRDARAYDDGETPLGEELDGMYDQDDGHYDDDPNPYAGTYSEE